jgi:hypothetical protein
MNEIFWAKVEHGGRWEVLKMQCIWLWVGIEARYMPKRCRARAQKLVEGMRK